MASKRKGRQRGLGRRPPSRYPKERFLIVCEGEKTERQYFTALRKILRSNLVEIKLAPDSKQDPRLLVRYAAKLDEEASADADKHDDDNQIYDHVFCVFDVDNHAKVILSEAIKLAEDESISLSISNPCFELWLLLHFEQSPRVPTARSAKSATRKHLPQYEDRLPFEKLHPAYAVALKNASALERRHTQNGTEGQNPSTGVHHLTELIYAKQ